MGLNIDVIKQNPTHVLRLATVLPIKVHFYFDADFTQDVVVGLLIKYF